MKNALKSSKSAKDSSKISMSKGGKTFAQTPAPKKDRIHGSNINKVGSAKDGKNVELSKETLNTIKNKLSKFKEDNPNKTNITLNDLKAVYRRGSGAYSTSHRPTISGGAPNSRAAWSIARVNKFLKKAGGTKVKAAYVQDDDLLEKGGKIKTANDYIKEKYGAYSDNKLTREDIINILKIDKDEYVYVSSASRIFNKYFGMKNVGSYRTDGRVINSMIKKGELKEYKRDGHSTWYNLDSNKFPLIENKMAKGGEIDNEYNDILIWHEKEGNWLVPKNQIYAWLYKDPRAGEKLRNKEYDFVLFPPTPPIGAAYQKGFVPPLLRIWTKEYSKTHKGVDDLIGIVKAYYDENEKKLYVEMMTTRKEMRRKGVNSHIIKQLRDELGLEKDQIEFVDTTKEGESFKKSSKYEEGGKINVETTIFIPPTLETIAKEHGVDMAFINEQYELGTKEELEHTPDIELAQAIALHHLNENPNYYIILKKAFEEEEANKLDGYYAKGGAISCEQLDENGERKIDMDSINTLTHCVMNLPQTKSMHFDYTTNRYTPERHRLHKDIIYNIKKDVVCINDDEPIAILMGGSPASGKSTFLKKYSPYLLNEEILKIDADEIRSKLPEYKGYNATQTHLETKDIVNTLLSDRNIGLPCKFDVIYDGTMNSTKSYIPLITLLKELGYKVFIVYIDKVQKDVIVKRALERYKKSGRFVPLEVIDDFFDKGTSAMEQLKFMVDGYMIIDGSNTDYKILSQGGMRLPKKRNYSKIGQPIQITEDEIITEFKKGGELDPDNPSIKNEITHKSGSAGGMLVGNRHSEGGIKAINKSTNQPLEMEGGEVVITRNAVSDDQKREFEGEMLTNREILSKINEGGGGVSFANGGDVPQYIMTSGKEYKYGGKTMKDNDIVSSCGCQHKMKEGGYMDDGITNDEFMHLKYGHKLQREGDLLIMNKAVPSFISFSKYNQIVPQGQLKETYKGLLKREYEINFDELPHAIKGALMIGNQKMIDNYINN